MSYAKTTLSLALSLLLMACGGGNSSSVATESGSGTGNVTSNPPSVTPIPPTTKPAYTDSNLLSMFNALTVLRETASAGQVLQQPSLDLAAQRHADYLVKNNLTSNGAYLYAPQENGQWGGHYESMLNAGFSGATPQARADAAGYKGAVNELAVFGAKSTAECVASLDNSVYHLVHLVSPYVDMGIYFNAGNGGESACIVLLGVAVDSPGQFAAVDQFVFYPARNQQNVAAVFFNQAERPNPAPDLPVAGRPVLMSFYNMSNKLLAAKDVVIHSFTIENAAGAQVPLRILAFPGVQTDGPSLVFDANMGAPGYVVALPTQPLLSKSAYKVNVSATVAGKMVTQQWSFTTTAN